MAKHTPDNPEERTEDRGAEMAADAPPRPTDETVDPHRAEPAPPPEEGLRPEADPSIVRPAEQEPYGPYGGLVPAAASEAAHEAPVPAPSAEAETAYLGVEEESVESAQIFGLMLATILAVVTIVLSIYFIFYLPKLNDTETAAEDVPAERLVELRELRAEAENLLGQYAVNPDAEDRYRIPVDVAMQQVVAAYRDPDGPPALYTDRVGFNLSWANLNPAPAVASDLDPGAIAVPGSDLPGVEASVAPAAEAPAEPPTPSESPAPPEQLP